LLFPLLLRNARKWRFTRERNAVDSAEYSKGRILLRYEGRAMLVAALLRLFTISAAGESIKTIVRTPPVILYANFKGEHSEISFKAMREEVDAIMGPIGLHFEWRSIPASSTGGFSNELVVVSFTGRCRMDNAFLPRVESGALGWTYLLDGHASSFSVVDCDRIRQFINPVVAAVRWEDRDGMLGRALGRVLVHELYHVFSDSKRHASRTLVRAFYTPHELVFDHPRLDEKDVDTLRNGRLHGLLEPKRAAQMLRCCQ
jgi:hypothetical protein